MSIDTLIKKNSDKGEEGKNLIGNDSYIIEIGRVIQNH